LTILRNSGILYSIFRNDFFSTRYLHFMEILWNRSVSGGRLCPACRQEVAGRADRCILCGFHLKKGRMPRARRFRADPPRPFSAAPLWRLIKWILLTALALWAFSGLFRRPLLIGPEIRHLIGSGTCPQCQGRGIPPCPVCGDALTVAASMACPVCKGTGNHNWRFKTKPAAACIKCRGSGQIDSRSPCPHCQTQPRPLALCEPCGGDGRLERYTTTVAMGLSPWEWLLALAGIPPDPNPAPQRNWMGGYPLVARYCSLPERPSQAKILEWGEFLPENEHWRMSAVLRLERNGRVTTNTLTFWVQDRLLIHCRKVD
jgi:hypothetical protein